MYYVITNDWKWCILAGPFLDASRALDVRDKLRSESFEVHPSSIHVVKIVDD